MTQIKPYSTQVIKMTLINDLKTYTVRGQEVLFSEIYYNNLLSLKELVANNFDAIEVDDGMEGGGKSELAKQKALLLNENFCEDDIVYTPEQFNEWVAKAKAGSVCLWDEFVLAGSTGDALTAMQNTLIKQFSIMRSKNLIIILVVPYIFMLRKYFAVARTRYLSHVYTNGLERGFVKVYDYNSKHYLYNYGQKTWLYNRKVIPSFEVRFSNWSHRFLDESKIEARKQKAFDELADAEKSIKLTRKQMAYLFPCINNIWDQSINNTEYKTINILINKIKNILNYQKSKET